MAAAYSHDLEVKGLHRSEHGFSTGAEARRARRRDSVKNGANGLKDGGYPQPDPGFHSMTSIVGLELIRSATLSGRVRSRGESHQDDAPSVAVALALLLHDGARVPSAMLQFDAGARAVG